MEQNSNDQVLRHMNRYSFEEDIKVVLLFEEDTEVEELDSPIKKNEQCSTTLKRKRIDFEIQSSSDIVYPNFNVHNTHKNRVDMHYQSLPVTQTNLSTGQQVCVEKTINHLVNSDQLINRAVTTDKHLILQKLDELSNNFIEISKSYYHNFIEKNDRLGIQQREKYYINFKEHYFRKSFNIVFNIFLPQHKKNNIFCEKFINRTVVLAKNKSWHVDKDYLRCLVASLLIWTQQKINLQSSLENRNRTCIEPSITNNNPTNGDQPTNDSNICLFSTGPRGQEISISILPEILQNTTTSKSINSKKRKIDEIHEFKNERLRNLKANRRPRDLGRKKQIETHKAPNLSFSIPTKDISYVDLSNDDDPIVVELENHLLNNENESIKRSSVSRDSGIVSPVYLQSQTLSTIPPTITEPIYTLPNPEVPSGYCKVCLSVTHNMCLGCFNEYYCSNECQNVDYDVHMFVCQKMQS